MMVTVTQPTQLLKEYVLWKFQVNWSFFFQKLRRKNWQEMAKPAENGHFLGQAFGL